MTTQKYLEVLRALERRRIDAIRRNDVETMSSLLNKNFIYINNIGIIYDKKTYLRAVGSHQLTYSGDIELTETDHRIDGDLVIIAGEMLGHARLEGEAQVYHLRSMRVWRRHGDAWRLLAWQSSAFLRTPTRPTP
jgi:ketosteroid isomerase-like protein